MLLEQDKDVIGNKAPTCTFTTQYNCLICLDSKLLPLLQLVKCKGGGGFYKVSGSKPCHHCQIKGNNHG